MTSAGSLENNVYDEFAITDLYGAHRAEQRGNRTKNNEKQNGRIMEKYWKKNDNKKVIVRFQCVYCSNECVVPKLSMDETPRRLHCDFGLRCAGEHGR